MRVVEVQIQEQSCTKDLFGVEQATLKAWNLTLEQEEIMWKKKSRIKWL